MNAKFTPGPWKIGTPPPNGEQTIGTAQGLMVAVATTGAGVQTKANATLIAAAPELMVVLERAIRRLEIAHANGDSIMREWIVDARAALASATGE